MFSMEFDEIVPELDNETLFDPFLCDPSQFLSCDSSCLSFVSNVVTKDPEYELNVDEEQNPVATRLTSLRAHQRTSKKKGEVRKRTVSQVSVKGSISRHRPASRNAARERSRVKSLRSAFLDLQNSLPSVPPNTKLSKLDVLVLATTYIAHLMKTLDEAKAQEGEDGTSYSLSDSVPAVLPSMTMVPFVGEERHHRLQEKGYLHPVRKWPMRSRLYAGVFEEKRGSSALQQLALPDVNYSMPLLDANLDVLFSSSSSSA